VPCDWKENWQETRRHFIDWWNGNGMVLGTWRSGPECPPRVETPNPGPPRDTKQRYTDPAWRAASIHWTMARTEFPLDALPLADVSIGPGSLALLLGSKAGLEEGTVWYHPTIEHVEEPETLPPLQFDPDDRWWRLHEETLRRMAELADGHYMVGCPDLIENIDTLASLRGSQRLLVDMAERPDWVLRVLEEINRAWFEAYGRIYDIIKLEDGSSAFGAFAIWGPGKTAKVQCDASAMFSPEMFERLVVPPLTEQCEWLDCSMFHLDGHQCIPHLDLLLGIEALDAVEWTPDPQVPSGGSPEWYPMYRRIKEAGKSVQAIGIQHDEIVPLLDAVGPEGLYVMTELRTREEAAKVARLVEPYR
jgi:hypothetical protein